MSPATANTGGEALHPDLAGGVAVVTGGGRGLGRSMAGALGRQGMHVALLDVLADVEDEASRLGQECGGLATMGVHADVTDEASLASALDAVAGSLGRPTVLVHAAGVTQWADSEHLSAADWRRVVDINLTGTFLACQAFAGQTLDHGGGTIVNVASMSGQIVNVPQHQAAYNASKAGVAHLTASLAVEWADREIRVNAIAPGYFLSEMTRQFTDANPELRDRWVEAIPAGRMGEPQDLDGLVAFLASSSSRYITGQSIVIDGGYTLV
jgi:NAD(P)-dependent dehydrogenase (short-subunit alcohol dehydrogenase family)